MGDGEVDVEVSRAAPVEGLRGLLGQSTPDPPGPSQMAKNWRMFEKMAKICKKATYPDVIYMGAASKVLAYPVP